MLTYLSVMELSSSKDPLEWAVRASEIRQGFDHYYTRCLKQSHNDQYRQFWRKEFYDVQFPPLKNEDQKKTKR